MGLDQQLIILLKAPLRGLVKTRLASETGEDAALAIYTQLLERLKVNLSEFPDTVLHFTPADEGARLTPFLAAGWNMQPQGEGDLGQRMYQAFNHAFAAQAGKVVMIGADCPEITPDDVQHAFDELDRHDLVLGPAQDGGYWLIGLKQLHRELFSGVRWSTNRVLTETLERAWQLDLRVAFLRLLSDIDTKSDWERYLQKQDQTATLQQ